MSGIVVGVGRADTSAAAVRWAAAEGVLRDLPLALVHAWDTPVDVTVEIGAGSLPGLSGPATTQAVHGSAATILLAQRPDLLVLGGHYGSPRLRHLTRTCLHHARCPVAVVPDDARPLTGRVVVGLCGTPASAAALRWAAAEARLRGAHLVAVHAWQIHPARNLRGQEGEANRRLHAWVAGALGDTDVELRAIRGAPVDRLLEAGEDADLMVLGRRVHRWLGQLVHGAVGDDLSGLAPCPVVIVPA